MAPEKAADFATITDDTSTKQYTQLRAMVADYKAGRRPLVSGPEARRTIEFITALYKSAATGKPVQPGTIKAGDPFYDHVGGTFTQSTAK
jgi:predicted dehydrogenase